MDTLLLLRAVSAAVFTTAAAAATVVAAAAVPPARPPATSPADTAPGTFPTTGPDGATLSIVITAVRGKVQVRRAEGRPWEPALVGMELAEGAEIRTLPKSAVDFFIPPDQLYTLDRVSRLTIARAALDGGRVVTDMGIDYGRAGCAIETGGVEHDSKIHSPSSTLAVRGTRAVLFDQPPFAAEVVSYTGAVDFTDLKKRVALGGRIRTTYRSGASSAAGVALAEAVVDPSIGRARTRAEAQLVADVASRGRVSLDRMGENVRPSGDGFDVVVSWGGDADVDVSYSYPGGFLAARPGLDRTPDARIVSTSQGGPDGGQESASFDFRRSGFVETIFVGATNVSPFDGRDHTARDVTIRAFEDGSPIPLPVDPADPFAPLGFAQNRGDIPPGATVLGVVFLGEDLFFLLPDAEVPPDVPPELAQPSITGQAGGRAAPLTPRMVEGPRPMSKAGKRVDSSGAGKSRHSTRDGRGSRLGKSRPVPVHKTSGAGSGKRPARAASRRPR